MLRAVATQKAPVLLAASAVASSHTGNTNETALATISIPAGAMGTGGGLEIRTVWSYTNSANNKILRARLGGASGTQYLADTVTTTASKVDVRWIKNRGAANSQVGGHLSSSPIASSTLSAITSAVDTSAATTVVISGQLANSGETITLEMYEVWLIPA